MRKSKYLMRKVKEPVSFLFIYYLFIFFFGETTLVEFTDLIASLIFFI